MADILHARVVSSGAAVTAIERRALSVYVFDLGGSQGERKRWQRHFGNVDAVVFVVALDQYRRRKCGCFTIGCVRQWLCTYQFLDLCGYIYICVCVCVCLVKHL